MALDTVSNLLDVEDPSASGSSAVRGSRLVRLFGVPLLLNDMLF